jgi:hypothetical protein
MPPHPNIRLDLAFLIHKTVSLHINARDERESRLRELVCMPNLVQCGGGMEIRRTFKVFVSFEWRS